MVAMIIKVELCMASCCLVLVIAVCVPGVSDMCVWGGFKFAVSCMVGG